MERLTMKTTVRTLFAAIAAVVMIASTAALAQNPPAGQRNWNPERMIEQRVSMLDRQLNLTPEQEKKITEILKNSYQSPSRESGNTSSRRARLNQDRAANNTGQREKVDAEIKKVLTAEQAKKYDTLPQGRQRGGMGMSVENRVEQYATRLKLTDDQKKKLQSIIERQDEERRASFEKMRESRGSGSSDAQREAMTKTMQAQNEKFAKEIDSILTAEQKKEHAAMQKELMERFRNMGRNGQGGQRRGGQNGQQ